MMTIPTQRETADYAEAKSILALLRPIEMEET
jgi:hypothetical protein